MDILWRIVVQKAYNFSLYLLIFKWNLTLFKLLFPHPVGLCRHTRHPFVSLCLHKSVNWHSALLMHYSLSGLFSIVLFWQFLLYFWSILRPFSDTISITSIFRILPACNIYKTLQFIFLIRPSSCQIKGREIQTESKSYYQPLKIWQ